MAVVLALAGALGWGVGDFLGGLAARRLAVLTVLAVSQAVGLVGVLAWAILSGDARPGGTELLPAAGAGIDFCRLDSTDKKGRVASESYRLGELLVHSGRTLHRRTHRPASPQCRRITLQGHALQLEGGTWILYW